MLAMIKFCEGMRPFYIDLEYNILISGGPFRKPVVTLEVCAIILYITILKSWELMGCLPCSYERNYYFWAFAAVHCIQFHVMCLYNYVGGPQFF